METMSDPECDPETAIIPCDDEPPGEGDPPPPLATGDDSWSEKVYMWNTWERVANVGSQSVANRAIQEIGVFATTSLNGAPHFYEWEVNQNSDAAGVMVSLDRLYYPNALMVGQNADHKFVVNGVEAWTFTTAPTLWYYEFCC